MAKQYIIPKEHMDILRLYGLTESGAVVLIEEEVYEALSPEVAQLLSDPDSTFAEEYSFGGDADVWLDVVTSDSHMYIESAYEQVEEK